MHLLQLPGINLEHPIWDWFSLLAAILSCTSQQQDSHLMSHKLSVHHGGPAQLHHTPLQCDDGWTSAADGSLIPTNCKSSPWFFAHIWIRAKLQYYWETTKCNKCNSRDPRRPPTRGTLTSVLVYERSLSPETSTTKVHQDIGCQQGIILSEKSWTKWLI